MTFVSVESGVSKSRLYYFYRQLTVSEQADYAVLLQGLLGMRNDIHLLRARSFDQIRRLIDLIIDDHPELFWFSGLGSLYQVGNTFGFQPKYTMSSAVKEEREQRLRRVTDAFLYSAGNCRTDLDCLEAAFNYLVKNVTYDVNSPDNQNICSALLNHRSVCAGYSRALQYLMHKMGRECLYVSGQASGEGRHGWNIVNLDGQYYHTDVTFGDRDFSEKGRKRIGMPADLSAEYAYLCMSDEEALRDRRIIVKGGIQPPKCISGKMSWYRCHNLYFFNADDAWKQIGWFLSRGRKSWCCQFDTDAAYKTFVRDISNGKFAVLAMHRTGQNRITTATSKNDDLRCVSGWI